MTSSGDEPPLPGLSAAGPSDAEAIRVGPVVPGDPVVAPGANSQGHGAVSAYGPALRHSTHKRRPGDANSHFQQPRHADTAGAVVVEWQIPRDGHERGRRLQSVEKPRRDPLGRRRYPRQLGYLLLPARRGERGILVNPTPAD